jgi:hypothetical protein
MSPVGVGSAGFTMFEDFKLTILLGLKLAPYIDFSQLRSGTGSNCLIVDITVYMA